MMKWRSSAQRKAVMASVNRGASSPSFTRKYPVLTGYLTTAGLGLAASPMAALAVRAVTRGSPVSGKQALRIFRAARKLYPQTAGILKSKGGGGLVHRGELTVLAEMGGGGAFTTGRVIRAGTRVSLVRLVTHLNPFARQPMREMVHRLRQLKPTVILDEFRAASPAILAHELGHAATHLGKGGRITQPLAGMGSTVLEEGTAFLGAAAANAGISRAPISERHKRQLHRVAGAIPLIAVSPVLADEALATKRGLRILRAAGASQRQVKRARRQLTAAYGSYLANAAPGVVGGGLMAHLYRKRSLARKRGHHRK